jgi:hypothetical protein
MTPQEIVDEQANDPMLWCVPGTIVEDVLQKALRRLHAAVERRSSEQCARDAINARL